MDMKKEQENVTQFCERKIIDFQKRSAQMKASRELWRCVCSLPFAAFPCPCPFFIDKQICHCAGESHEGFTQEEWTEYNLNKIELWENKKN